MSSVQGFTKTPSGKVMIYSIDVLQRSGVTTFEVPVKANPRLLNVTDRILARDYPSLPTPLDSAEDRSLASPDGVLRTPAQDRQLAGWDKDVRILRGKTHVRARTQTYLLELLEMELEVPRLHFYHFVITHVYEVFRSKGLERIFAFVLGFSNQPAEGAVRDYYEYFFKLVESKSSPPGSEDEWLSNTLGSLAESLVLTMVVPQMARQMQLPDPRNVQGGCVGLRRMVSERLRASTGQQTTGGRILMPYTRRCWRHYSGIATSVTSCTLEVESTQLSKVLKLQTPIRIVVQKSVGVTIKAFWSSGDVKSDELAIRVLWTDVPAEHQQAGRKFKKDDLYTRGSRVDFWVWFDPDNVLRVDSAILQAQDRPADRPNTTADNVA